MNTTARAAAIAIALTAATHTAAQSADIVVFGDSWANRLAAPLQQTLDSNGLAGVTVLNAAFEGERADDMASDDPNAGLPYIEATLNNNPNAELVHLSIGGNDLFDGFLFINIDSIVNALLDRIVDDTETVVREILRVRPDAEVYQSGYDFLRPLPLTNPARVNEVMLDLDQRLASLAQSIPGYTYESYYGFAQITFGIPELGIPVGDPSLPRIDLPSPEATFIDEIHYTPAVYQVFADELFERFYEPRLTTPCLADVNDNGLLEPGDFTAWVAAYNAGAPAADQNGDGLIQPDDFTAWVANYNIGC